MKTLAAFACLLIAGLLWLKFRKKLPRLVKRDDFSVEFETFPTSSGVVFYREGEHEISFYTESGRRKSGKYSYLFLVPELVAFNQHVTGEQAAQMLRKDMTLLHLPKQISLPDKLSEKRIAEIRERISKALDELNIAHAFVREGWTSAGDANEITQLRPTSSVK